MGLKSILFCSAILFLSCTKKTSSPNPQNPIQLGNGSALDSSRAQVMVIDSGFDTANEVFKNKIVSQNTIVCQEVNSGESDNSGTSSYEQMKQQAIKSLSKKDESCHLQGGIAFSSSPSFSEILSFRDKWNRAIRDKSSLRSVVTESQFDQIVKILSGSGTSYNYHGTATAGLIAYQNENLQLHLVEKKLGKPETPATGATTASCPKQSEIDLMVQLLSEPEVQQAYINAPISSEEEEISQLIQSYKIQYVNMSFGAMPRQILEDEIAKECSRISLAGYFNVRSNLEYKRFEAKKVAEALNPDTLFVQAAGNESVRVDSGADAFECVGQQQKNRILIGSYNNTQTLSGFSNYGKCVEFYSLGEMVVVASPRDFLFVEDGTSFSSPLVVRYASKIYKQNMHINDTLAALRSQKDANGYLKSETFPVELAYQNKNFPVTQYALVPTKPLAAEKQLVTQAVWARYRLEKDLAILRKN